jgi:hypothetical protein
MSRLFTFGCSFTNYSWPTWADILAKEFNYFQNWGRPGAGNQFIYHTLIECHLKNQINTDDTVVIMWSSSGRENRYVKGQWLTPGNIYNSNLYDKNYIKSWVDTRGFILRDLDLIYGALMILENIGCRYKFFSMLPLTTINDYSSEDFLSTVSDFLPYYKTILNKIEPSIFEVVFDNNWDSREFSCANKKSFWQDWYDKIKDKSWPDLNSKSDYHTLPQKIKSELTETFGYFIPNPEILNGRVDYHPTPLEHLEYLDKVGKDFLITDQTREWIKDCDKKVRSNAWVTDDQAPGIKIW